MTARRVLLPLVAALLLVLPAVAASRPPAKPAPAPPPGATTTTKAAPAAAGARAPRVADAAAAKVPVHAFQLDNGMRFLLVRRPELATVVAGWVAHVGSANERPGITGLAHLFEHMLFKGTRRVGTTDVEKDLQILGEQEDLQEKIRQQYRLQRERYRKGEIADPFAGSAATPELEQLQKQFQELVEQERKVMVKNEYDTIYTGAGASNINAFTTNDLTGFFVTVPANKVELWFWMESDRLLEPVFREFYAERDVVHEERRMRTESTPTGPFDEEFDALFWEAHPYHWPVVGWPSDLRVISRDEAEHFFKTYYSANNVTAVLVGNFDPAQVEALARRYFGRLQPSPSASGAPSGSQPMVPDVVTLEPEQLAEKRMLAECDCEPQVRVRYHTVAFEHRDDYALDVLSGVLNGRTGRLYKSMVLGQQIASDVSSNQDSRKYAGDFEVQLQAKGEHTPEELEQAWYRELDRLQKEPVPAAELQKVKNQIAADAFRRLENPFYLMLQLIYYDGLGDWHYLESWTPKTLAVTAADVQRVAQQYFQPKNRAVAVYHRKAAAPSGSQAETASDVPPEVAKLPTELQGMVKQQLARIAQEGDAAKLAQGIDQLTEAASKAPPEMKPALKILLEAAEKRMADLRPAQEKKP